MTKDPRVTKVLVPGLDLLNHSPDAQVEWQWSERQCCILAGAPILPGCEVFNNYGPKSDEELLLGYGCRLASNAGNKFHFRFKQHHDVLHWLALGPLNDPVFSPQFLHLCALAMASPRETSLFWTEFPPCDGSWTRNQYKVLVFITTLLESSIHKLGCFNHEPTNAKQRNAADYRRDQLHILNVAYAHYVTLAAGVCRAPNQICSLETILKTPSASNTELRRVLKSIFRTATPSRLRQRGAETCAFSLWVLTLLQHPGPWADQVLDWLNTKTRTAQPQQEILRREFQETIDSCREALRIGDDSVFGKPNDEFLRQCVIFVEEEAIWHARDSDEDEMIMFIDQSLG